MRPRLDAEIADLSRRIDNLDHGGVDATEERRALQALRRRQRAHPIPARSDLLGGRYLLDAEVGRGGFSSVWRAYDQQDHSTVAIKILHANRPDPPR